MTNANNPPPVRVGLVGFGYIGAELLKLFQASSGAIVPAFVYNRSAERLRNLSPELVCTDLGATEPFAADLIVEMAHPDITREYGEVFLRHADYMPLSVTALADDKLLHQLQDTATAHGKRLFVPHGALLGMSGLLEQQSQWEEVTITFRKPPQSLDFSAAPELKASASHQAYTVYDGPVRGIASRFPRNVNTMVTCALASVGLDRCRAILIAEPGLDRVMAKVEARGRDGSTLMTEKAMPAVGVSGTEMFASLYQSILSATGTHSPLAFV